MLRIRVHGKGVRRGVRSRDVVPDHPAGRGVRQPGELHGPGQGHRRAPVRPAHGEGEPHVELAGDETAKTHRHGTSEIAYQDDYLFASPAERLLSCGAPNPHDCESYSDNSPILATFES